MSTFKKYLIYFSTIGVIIFCVGEIFSIIIDGHLFDAMFIPFLILGLCIFIFPMSAYFSSIASTTVIEVENTEADIYSNIEKIAMQQCKRTQKTKEEGKIIYKMPDPLSKWLTNPIVVKKNGNLVTIETPKAYESYFRQLKKESMEKSL
ncbi:MAG: hypothetical protein SPL99_10390 [Catonella sp.]|nr:hypothetical protein [Catonella sp.]MDY6357065.1 hypothetical protein [Catonella sp.]